jgi:uncharacterized tellurite resistance protein B-like protein
MNDWSEAAFTGRLKKSRQVRKKKQKGEFFLIDEGKINKLVETGIDKNLNFSNTLYRFDIDLRNNLPEIRRGGYTILFLKIK